MTTHVALVQGDIIQTVGRTESEAIARWAGTKELRDLVGEEISLIRCTITLDQKGRRNIILAEV